MNTKHTLESVQADFQLWRQSKANSRSRIPEHLKKNAVTLLADMSQGKITKTLGISSSMLTTWAAQQKQNCRITDAIEFMALPVEPPIAVNEGKHVTLNLTQANGNQWCLQGELSIPQLELFIRTAGRLEGTSQ